MARMEEGVILRRAIPFKQSITTISKPFQCCARVYELSDCGIELDLFVVCMVPDP